LFYTAYIKEGNEEEMAAFILFQRMLSCLLRTGSYSLAKTRTKAHSLSNNAQLPATLEKSAVNGAEKVIVVVPTLNEETGVGFVLDSLERALHSYNYNALIVDGHSSDGTVKIAEDKGAFVIFQSSKGYGDALRTGFVYACDIFKADIVVMLDGDGTYDPYDIPSLLQVVLENKADMAIGNRFDRMDGDAMPFVNIVGNRLLSLVGRILLQLDVSDTQCGLRAIRSYLVRKIKTEADGMPFAIEMLAQAKKEGARISELPVSYHPRRGVSKLNRFGDGFDILRRIFAEALS
jgi:glycosyltransferase involved in cell wall biosynthesis